ncbi:hypothetical protein O9993_03335 [Vibrio lentus]|nr:hypothetical protein [Vibrio lentus]
METGQRGYLITGDPGVFEPTTLRFDAFGIRK